MKVIYAYVNNNKFNLMFKIDYIFEGNQLFIQKKKCS